MRIMLETSQSDASRFARQIVDMPETELTELVHRLRYYRQLTRTIHALNGLTRMPVSADLGRRALSRLVMQLLEMQPLLADQKCNHFRLFVVFLVPYQAQGW